MQRPILIDEKIVEQIEGLARLTGKPERKIATEVVELGLRNYKKSRPSAARVLLYIADYAKKIKAKGPKDLSTKHDKYLYDE